MCPPFSQWQFRCTIVTIPFPSTVIGRMINFNSLLTKYARHREKSTVFVSGPTTRIIVYGPLLYSVRHSVTPAPPYSLIVNYSNIPRFQGHPIYRLALSTPRAALVQVGRSSNHVYSIPTHSRNRYYHEICIKPADFTLCVRFSLDSTDDIAFF